ncbi:MAG TPA: DUF4835 family protein [Bacteroidota bacterium]
MLRHCFAPFLLLMVASFVQPVKSQQLDCTVHVNYEAVANSHGDRLADLQRDISEYLNGYKWGTDNLEEKISCTLNIFISSATENRYSAQVFIGSQRKLFGTEKSSAVLRLFDESWDFSYVRNQPINHNLYTFSDMGSFLDFYAFLITGYDYDTYEKMGGTPFFQKAADVANLARTSSQKGWLPTTGSNYNRAVLIDDIQNAKYAPVRSAMYAYHFTGLDSLTIDTPRAYQNILDALDAIGEVARESDRRNQIIRAVFDTKYLEIADLFLSYPEKNVYTKFASIDPAHRSTYEEYQKKER